MPLSLSGSLEAPREDFNRQPANTNSVQVLASEIDPFPLLITEVFKDDPPELPRSEIKAIFIYRHATTVIQQLPPELRMEVLKHMFRNHCDAKPRPKVDNTHEHWIEFRELGEFYHSHIKSEVLPDTSLEETDFGDWRWIHPRYTGLLAAEALQAVYETNPFRHSVVEVEHWLVSPRWHTIDVAPGRFVRDLSIHISPKDLDKISLRDVATRLTELPRLKHLTIYLGGINGGWKVLLHKLEDRKILADYLRNPLPIQILKQLRDTMVSRSVEVSVFMLSLSHWTHLISGLVQGGQGQDYVLMDIGFHLADERPPHSDMPVRQIGFTAWAMLQLLGGHMTENEFLRIEALLGYWT
ncbi:hypothetical protein BU16DRAFT_539403 [Lophium mytilinum]|uniref:Uncharacterized protein n=1 Tax=Lophium mytilinum TaxID=390894 RepID=A0A6A6QWR4_9PEZI|nr:hypothetical protein BU16DRAFT_539403 [Lophium mytilinum]